MKLIRTISSLLVISVLFINSGFAQAIFNGGDFSVDANWSGGSKPASGADIAIVAGASMNVDVSYSCNSIKLNHGSVFFCSGGSILTVGTGGILDENGDLAIAISSTLQISSGIEVNPPATSGSLTDFRDGQVYNWVRIGNQVWMAENLNYYTPSGTWYYNNDSVAYAAIYGRLYNWNTAMNGEASSSANPSGVQGICPPGWHLPSETEWTVLIDFLGGVTVAGGKMKEIGTTHWVSDIGATNESGFTALPGSYRNFTGVFEYLGYAATWWGSTSTGLPGSAYRCFILNSGPDIYPGPDDKDIGQSIRCIQN